MLTTEVLMKSSVPVPTYTEPRGGSRAFFTVDVVVMTGTLPVLSIVVEHKNREDTTFTTAGTFDTFTVPGMQKKKVSDLKEDVRLSFTMEAGRHGPGHRACADVVGLGTFGLDPGAETAIASSCLDRTIVCEAELPASSESRGVLRCLQE